VRDAATESNRYFASKVLADEALAALRAETGLDLVTILPGWMFGPGDAGPTAAGQLVLDAIANKLPPAALPGDITVADARDVAAAMVNAATVATPGERFIVAGRHYTLPDILAHVARAAGRTPPRFTLPYPAAWGFAVFSEASAAVRGVEPLVTRMHLRTLNGGDNLSSQHAIDRLGVTFRPLDATLADTVAWFQANMRRTNAGGSSTSAASREARASA
jgi:dihydroflavonol-4-reductase